jgi:hypothetical protein
MVQKMAGHSSVRMTDKYSHVDNLIDFAAAKKRWKRAISTAELKKNYVN